MNNEINYLKARSKDIQVGIEHFERLKDTEGDLIARKEINSNLTYLNKEKEYIDNIINYITTKESKNEEE